MPTSCEIRVRTCPGHPYDGMATKIVPFTSCVISGPEWSQFLLDGVLPQCVVDSGLPQARKDALLIERDWFNGALAKDPLIYNWGVMKYGSRRMNDPRRAAQMLASAEYEIGRFRKYNDWIVVRGLDPVWGPLTRKGQAGVFRSSLEDTEMAALLEPKLPPAQKDGDPDPSPKDKKLSITYRSIPEITSSTKDDWWTEGVWHDTTRGRSEFDFADLRTA